MFMLIILLGIVMIFSVLIAKANDISNRVETKFKDYELEQKVYYHNLEEKAVNREISDVNGES